MKLVVAQRGSIPLIDVAFRIGSGTTAAPGDNHALTEFAFMLADKGTRQFDAHELAAERDKIAMGGRLSAGLEDSSFGYRILRSKLDESLQLSATSCATAWTNPSSGSHIWRASSARAAPTTRSTPWSNC
jgi:hypothetical protein